VKKKRDLFGSRRKSPMQQKQKDLREGEHSFTGLRKRSGRQPAEKKLWETRRETSAGGKKELSAKKTSNGKSRPFKKVGKKKSPYNFPAERGVTLF